MLLTDSYAPEHWLRLALTPGLGCRSQIALLRRFSAPGTALAKSSNDLREILQPGQIEALRHSAERSDWPELVEHLEWLNTQGNHLITLGDPLYPPSLLQLPDPPTIFFAKGNISLLNQASLAIVGSRQATAQGIDNAEAFATELSGAGMTIVSGLAAGIDAAAHRGGLAGKGSTIAVIGTGLDRVYPASNRDLAHAIAETGVIVSEFTLGCPPIADNFPRRNRLIAALGLGCLVVEASLGSGSLITAKQAAELGREVFAIPGSIHSPQSKGCHRLIKDGAKLVESAKDIYDELAVPSLLDLTEKPSSIKMEHPVLDAMGWDSCDIETLAARCQMDAASLSATLLELELEGAINAQPGGRYQRRA